MMQIVERILAKVVGIELSKEEMELVSGGHIINPLCSPDDPPGPIYGPDGTVTTICY
jgi:hypothetical protein